MKAPLPQPQPARIPPAAALAAVLLFSLASGAADRALQFSGSAQYVQLPPGETVLVEDQAPRFSASPAESWLPGGGGTWHRSSDASAIARWTPDLPRAGTYKIYARLAGTPGSLDPAAQYVVKHAGGLSTNVFDQNSFLNQPLLLGTFEFQANREELVMLRPSGAGLAIADAVQFVNQDAFNFANSFTVETWVNISATTQPFQSVIAKGDTWALSRHNNYVRFRTRDATGATHDLQTLKPLLSDRWFHLAATFDGAKKILYVNGAVSSSAVWQAALGTNTSPVWFGGSAETPSSNYFNGALENVRIWSLARSATELQDSMNRTTRGTEPGLLGEWRFDDDLTDFETTDSAAGALHGLLRQSNSPPTQVTGLALSPPLAGSLALRFNGSDESVRVETDSRFDFSSACTIESWVYFDFPPTTRAGLVSKGSDAGWELALEPNGKLLFRTDGVNGPAPGDPGLRVAAPELLSKSRLDPGTWYHIAAVWNGPAGTKQIYVNGVADATATGLEGQLTPSPGPVLFAARPGVASGFFEGVLDEVRLWSIARSGSQVSQNFGRDLNGLEPGLAGFWKFDEPGGLVAADKSPYAVKADASLEGGMSDLNRVAGRQLSPALLLQYCMSLDGNEQFIQVSPADIFNLSNLTIEAWVKPAGAGLRTILRKGDYGYGLAIDEAGYLRFSSTKPLADWPRSSLPLELERDSQGNAILDSSGLPVGAWNHVAVVVNTVANTTTFYINGQPSGSHSSSLVVNNTGPFYLGRGWMPGSTNYFQGLLDEVRLWNIARPSVEIDLFAFTPLLGSVPSGLIGYWTFNEGTGTSLVDHSGGAHNGAMVGLDLNDWQEGTDWGLPALPSGIGGLNPNTNAAGLWLGQVLLSKVNEVQQATQGAADLVTDTGHPATVRILLHVAANGQVRLLKDVILMRKPGDDSSPIVTTNPASPIELSTAATNLVLVTRPELIPNYQGVMKRGGKLVGLRYGSAAYDFEGLTLPLLGGVGPGLTSMGRITLSKYHPTNPYRHKYHPDHQAGFDIVRQITLLFDGAPGDPWLVSPGYGVDRLTGTYRETVTGLHKIPLRVEGTVRLDRINTVNILDDGQ